jgi:hypothetical protein
MPATQSEVLVRRARPDEAEALTEQGVRPPHAGAVATAAVRRAMA